MAEKRPLVLYSGKRKELQDEDTLYGASGDGSTVKVSASDASAGYLTGKLLEGDGIELTTVTTNAPTLNIIGNGADGSTTILDSADPAHTITNSALTISTTRQKFGAGSLRCPGTGAATISSWADLALGSGNFTIEWWEWRDNANDNNIVLAGSSTGGMCPWYIGHSGSGNVVCYISSNNSSWDIASGRSMGSIETSAWIHRCITRSGTTFRTFKNGTVIETWTSSASVYTNTGLTMAIGGVTTAYFNGNIQGLRFHVGTALYTSDFTPDETAFAASQQLEITNTSPTPTGSLFAWPISTAPSGFLLCYGQAISRTTYSSLYAVLGVSFGTGDGSTTFNLPDLRGRMIIGLDNLGGTSANRVTAATADTLGGASGAETHALSEAELASHTHTDSGHTHWQKFVDSNNGHRNWVSQTQTSGSQSAGWYSGDLPAGTDSGATSYDKVWTNSGNAVISNTGSGTAHNNMPPYIALNWIIKT